MTAPDGISYTLFDDGKNEGDQANDGLYGLWVGDVSAPLVTGVYSFTVTDNDNNITTSTDQMETNFIGFPEQVSPQYNSFVTQKLHQYSAGVMLLMLKILV